MATQTVNINGWEIHSSGDEYLHVRRDEKPGDICIKADTEGFVIDVFSDDDDLSTSVATTCAPYNDLSVEE